MVLSPKFSNIEDGRSRKKNFHPEHGPKNMKPKTKPKDRDFRKEENPSLYEEDWNSYRREEDQQDW